jgi:Uma2 family endonuclease
MEVNMTATALAIPARKPRSIPATEVIYPDSDGKPMADNTRQFRYIVTIQGGVAAMFADRPDVFVAGDLLWYPVEGDNTIRAAPDTMVVFGRPPGDRGSYMQWREEGLAPQVAFEVLSPGNTRTEMIRKRQFYERYGVEEYYEYDPDRGTLKGWLRQDDRLESIPQMEGWISPRLGVRFTMEGSDLVLYRPDGRRFETFLELEQRAEAERQRAETERQRAEAERQQGREEGLQEGLQQALDRLMASGMAEDQARRLLMLHPS